MLAEGYCENQECQLTPARTGRRFRACCRFWVPYEFLPFPRLAGCLGHGSTASSPTNGTGRPGNLGGPR